MLTALGHLYAQKKEQLDTYAKEKPHLLSRVYLTLGRAVDYFTEDLLPMPEKKVNEFAKAHLPKATAAFTFASMYDESWLLNAGSSFILQKFTHGNSERGERRFIRDMSVLLFAMHTVKAVHNATTFWNSPSLPALTGLVCDVAALLTLNNVLFEHKPESVVKKN